MKLCAESLRVAFRDVVACDDVDVSIANGERLAIVGESGSGKSTLLRAMMGMLSPASGCVTLDGLDLRLTKRRDLARHVQLVFQHAHAALDPRRRIRAAIADTRFGGAGDPAALLAEVGLDVSFLSRFPHELSGGQAQRVGLARALNGRPELLLLDEPVSALDVSVRAQIIELLRRLHDERGLGWVVVTHDLAIVPHLATRVAVMLRGRIVEEGTVAEVLGDPLHPYTLALRAASPVPEPEAARRALDAVDVQAPVEGAGGRGCAHAARCPLVESRCRTERPSLGGDGDHRVACHVLEVGREEAAGGSCPA